MYSNKTKNRNKYVNVFTFCYLCFYVIWLLFFFNSLLLFLFTFLNGAVSRGT